MVDSATSGSDGSLCGYSIPKTDGEMEMGRPGYLCRSLSLRLHSIGAWLGTRILVIALLFLFERGIIAPGGRWTVGQNGEIAAGVVNGYGKSG